MVRALAFTFAFCAAVPALAIFPDNPTSGYKSVGMLGTVEGGKFKISGCGVAIAPGWVVSAAHVGGRTFVQDGVRHTVEKKVFHKTADLALFKLEKPVPHHSPVYVADFQKLNGQKVALVGYGNTSSPRSDGWSPKGGTEGVRRLATNTLDLAKPVSYNLGSSAQPKIKSQDCLIYDLDDPADLGRSSLGKGATEHEGGVASRDSGGGWFVQENGKPRLVAISLTVTVPEGSSVAGPYKFGGWGVGLHLARYMDWIRASMQS